MSRFFGKLREGSTRFFNKVAEDAPKFLGTISNGLHTGSNFINKIADVGSRIADNPITMSIAPELSVGLHSLTNGLRAGSKFLDSGAHLTNAKSYRGDLNQVSNRVLERAHKVKENGNKIRMV